MAVCHRVTVCQGVDVSRCSGSVSGGGGEQMGWQCVRGLR